MLKYNFITYKETKKIFALFLTYVLALPIKKIKINDLAL